MKIENKDAFIKGANLYFDKLFSAAMKNGCGEIELATFKPYPIKQYFTDFNQASEYAYTICNSKKDIFIGVNTRVGRKGDRENIHFVNAFHADIDVGEEGHKKQSELQDLDEAKKLIDEFHLKPSIVLSSGGGYHCFWILNDPVKVSDIGKDELESINRYLIESLKGDIGTQNINRHLRIPGTYNFKEDYYIKPEVTVYFDGGPTYDFNDFKEYINVKNKKIGKSAEPIDLDTNPIALDMDIKKLPISDKMKKLIMHGNDGSYDSRSNADSAVVTALIHKGYEQSQINQIFQRYAIGEKYREQKSPEKYLAHTINNAKKYSNLTEDELQDPLFISGAITKDDKGNHGFNVVNFVEYIVKKYKFKYFEKEKAFFQYNEYCYQQISDDQLNFLCQSELKEFKRFFPKSAMVNFIHFAVGACLINTVEAYDHQKRYLTLKNGLYDLNKELLISHDSNIFTTNFAAL